MPPTNILAGLNQDQLACVTCVDRPLLVSAGAGSGKTFMLTRRIAYALAHPEISGVHHVGTDVLAITFTELAAAEIKARVRSTLRSMGSVEGVDMVGQALAVDAAWIGTIHGMCSRILKEHALELGLDPSFEILDETDRDDLLLESVNDALRDAGAADTPEANGEGSGDRNAAVPMAGDEAVAELFSLFEARTVRDMLTRVIETAAGVYAGVDALERGPEVPPARVLARGAYSALQDIERAAHMLGIDANGKQRNKFTSSVLDSVNAETGLSAFERLAANDNTTYEELAQALAQFNPKFGTAPKDLAGANIEFRLAYDETCLSCVLGLARKAMDGLVKLARSTAAIFARKKRLACVLDQNDLMTSVLDALERHPRIAEQYRNTFKLVMVDEFQDTSALQIRIVGHLDGENDARLCTVGDTQQSIYRFRGADVDTYREHKRHMRDPQGAGAEYRELGCNYRSHGDVIAFVNRVFAQDQVFGSGPGSEFIELDAYRAHDGADICRIDVELLTSEYKSGVTTQHKAYAKAELICDRFCALHEGTWKSCDGSDYEESEWPHYDWGDMVILLGKMSQASVYAQALRARGIPCVITGGSVFSQMPESKTVCMLAQAVANPLDNHTLKNLLASEMFGLSPDELLRLGSRKTEEGFSRRGFWAGLRASGERDASPRVRLAASVLLDAVHKARYLSPSTVLTEAVIASGWLDRLQQRGAQGLAVAANVLKAIRLTAAQEGDVKNPRGIATVAQRLATKFERGMKEPPGALNARGQNAVRIMTIHASKGLEFPVVALADFHSLRQDRDDLHLETVGERVFMSLRAPKSSLGDVGSIWDLASSDYKAMFAKATANEGFEPPACTPSEAEGAAEFYRAVARHGSEGELAEARRKFYVGATRPREVLIVAMDAIESKSGSLDTLVDDVRQALFGSEGSFATCPEGIDFGGNVRAKCGRCLLRVDEDGTLDTSALVERFESEAARASVEDAQERAADESSLLVPEPVDVHGLLPRVLACDPVRASVFSYSSIAAPDTCDEFDPDEYDLETPLMSGDPELGVKKVPVDATAFGSAFHAAAQLTAEQARVNGEIAIPNERRLLALLKTWGVPASCLDRLRAAVGRWVSSELIHEAYSYSALEPEAPFCAKLAGPQGEPIHLTGAIDLLCYDDARDGRALIVDYKTGPGTLVASALHEKYLLQAKCYAYAALTQGFLAVDLAFVRVESSDPACPSQPQVARYSFVASDVAELESDIREAYAAAM